MTPSRLRVLITGATGCAGSHLSELALAHGAEVFGFAHTGSFVAGVTGRWIDLLDRASIENFLRDTQPEWIFHLAALIPGAMIDPQPERFIAVNITGTYYLLDTLRRIVPQARTLIASSSAVYGRPRLVVPGKLRRRGDRT